MTSSASVGAIVLGAGFSRRYGSDKRVETLGNLTVAETTVGKYVEVFDAVRIVIKHDDTHLRNLLERFSCEFIVAEDAHLGMGHSLASGISDLSWQWAFVALMDMPYIRTESLSRLYRTAKSCVEPAIIVGQAPGHSGTTHPVGWHRDYFYELERCTGDKGARDVLRANHARILGVQLHDPGLYRDIDHPEDLDLKSE